MNSVYIGSWGAKPIGKYRTIDENEMALDVIAEAVKKIDLDPSLIEGLITTPNTDNNQNMHGSRICEAIRIQPKVIAVVGCGGMSGGAAIRCAYNEIAMGNVECLVLYVAAKEHSSRYRPRGTPPKVRMGSGDYHPTFQPFSQLGIWVHYGSSARRYMHDFGATEEDFALATIKDDNNAHHNYLSAFKDKNITVEDIMKSPPLSTPIKLLDSCAVRDGAAALIFMNETLARKYSQIPIKISGFGESHDSCNFLNKDPSRSLHDFPALRNAANEALDRAHKKLTDIDVAELYAPFSPCELMIPENIGFFEKGEMIKRIKDGSTEPDGQIPINTLGGVIGRGHPALTTPVYEVIDLLRQLQEEAGVNQVPDAEVGFTQCEGGLINNIFVTILEKEVGKQ